MTKNKLILILAAIIALLGITSYRMIGRMRAQKIETDRWRENARAVSDILDRYKTTDDAIAVETVRQRKTIVELKRQNEELCQRLKAMRIRPRRAESVTTLAANTACEFRPDTVWLTDTVRLAAPARRLSYSDPWISFSEDTTVRIETRDSLIIVRHGRRRRFLWWRWTSGNGKITVTNKNPYSTIVGVETIDIE